MNDGEAIIYCYSFEDPHQIKVEDIIEKIISHESTHLTLYTATNDFKVCRALDNLETWGHYPYSYPE